MSLLKEIEDKGAVLEWSPVVGRPNLVALGTKDSSGVGFDDYGGGIELHSLDFADSKNTSSKLLGKAKSNSRFASLAWSQMACHQTQFPYGLIAGGMMDGFINAWDPAKFMSDQPPLLASIEQHQGAISGLHFNPHKESSHLLASGGNDGEVYVMSLERPDQPNVFIPAPPPNNAKHTADITKTVWNTQVAHIVGTSAQNGVCYVWDLRQKKAWCEIRDPTGGCVSDIAWNPDQGLHFITASGEDKNPVIKLWDLRSSTSVPLATLQGHTEGVLSLSWCPHDTTFLLSCGKDNRTILWDLFHLQPVYDLPNDSSVIDHHKQPSQGLGSPNRGANGSNNSFGSLGSGLGVGNGFDMQLGVGGGSSLNPNDLFSATHPSTAGYGGGLANTAGQKRYDIKWSPCLKSVVSTCSFDRKVHFFSLSGVQSKLNRAPKWLKRPMGLHYGFGGKLVHFDQSNLVGLVPSAANKAAIMNVTKIYSRDIVEDVALIDSCTKFHQILASSTSAAANATAASAGDKTAKKSQFAHIDVNVLKDYCDVKTQASDLSSHDKKIWSLMKVICFSKNARAELLNYLGFKKEDITKAVETYVQTKNPNASGTFHIMSPVAVVGAEGSVASGTEAQSAQSTTPITTHVPTSTNGTPMSASDVFGVSTGLDQLDLTPHTPSASNHRGLSAAASMDSAEGVSSDWLLSSPTHSASALTATATAATVSAVTLPPAVTAVTPPQKPLTKEELETEEMIREAIVVGNFSAAVELCIQTDQMAEALILAQCGDQTLWLKTQSIFFEKSKNKHKFITILESIIKNDLFNYVISSDLKKWKETLAVCSTYGKSDEYPVMCEKLGYRLQHELHDLEAASLCYMCSSNVNATILFWTEELKRVTSTSIGSSNIHTLQNFIEKVSIFSKANPDVQLTDDCINLFAEYASLIAAQGQYEIALAYLKGVNIQEKVLMDRLYTAASALGRVPAGVRPVDFPFERVNVLPVAAPVVGGQSAAGQSATVLTATPSVVSGAAASMSAKPVAASASGRIGGAIATGGASMSMTVNPTAAARPGHAMASLQRHPALQAQQQAAVNPVAASVGAAATQQVLAPGWQQTVDPSSGRPYYFNQATGQSAWDPPMVAVAPVAAAVPVSTLPQQPQQSMYGQPSVGVSGMYGQQPVSTGFNQPQQPQQQPMQPGVFKPMASVASPTPVTAAVAPMTSTGFNPTPSVMAQQPRLPAPAPAPAPVIVKKDPLPDTEGILLLSDMITAVTNAANAAERRQMAMVNEALTILRRRNSDGEVAPEILQKVHQFAVDISTRNFQSASAIQADLANTAWNDHKEWVKGLKVFIQIASKK